MVVFTSMDSRFLTSTQSRMTYFSPSSSNLSFFQQQALQVGMNDVYFTRSEYVRGGVGTREMIQCEIEKEQIREEIIGAEIARLRTLEAERRREILMNRDSALQTSLGFLMTMHYRYDGTSNERLTSLAPSAVGAFDGMHQSGKKLSPLAPSAVGVFNRMHQFGEKLSPLALSAAGVFNRMHQFGERLYPLAPSAVGVSDRVHHFGGTCEDERLSPLAPSAVEVFNRMSLESNSSFQEELVGNKESTNVNSNIYEEKGTEEAQAAEAACQHPVTRVNKKSEWSCALCQVSTTSEQSLNDHLQGKKHKSKASKLKAKNTGIGSSVSKSRTGKKTAPKHGMLLLQQ